MAPSPPNVDNRTLWISDNLPFLRALDTDSVDLVVIDPPFGKQQTFEGNLKPPLTDAELEHEYDLLARWGVQNEQDAYEMGVEFPDQSGTTAKFSDIWDFRYQVTQADWDWLEAVCPAARSLVETTRLTHSDGIAGYITFMTLRMLEIHRILKPTGSVYLHCDHQANAYLRQMMDAVFGQAQFRNEIIWSYRRWPAKTPQFQKMHDTLLWYTKGKSWAWNQLYEPLAESTLKQWGENKQDAVFTKSGKRLRSSTTDRKSKGAPLRAVWDIRVIAPSARERTGYPTQKPQALARRIIEASSNPGDLVLDCFAGCAYVPVAAELLGRRWIACDMSPRAWTVVRRQFEKQPDLGSYRGRTAG